MHVDWDYKSLLFAILSHLFEIDLCLLMTSFKALRFSKGLKLFTQRCLEFPCTPRIVQGYLSKKKYFGVRCFLTFLPYFWDLTSFSDLFQLWVACLLQTYCKSLMEVCSSPPKILQRVPRKSHCEGPKTAILSPVLRNSVQIKNWLEFVCDNTTFFSVEVRNIVHYPSCILISI